MASLTHNPFANLEMLLGHDPNKPKNIQNLPGALPGMDPMAAFAPAYADILGPNPTPYLEEVPKTSLDGELAQKALSSPKGTLNYKLPNGEWKTFDPTSNEDQIASEGRGFGEEYTPVEGANVSFPTEIGDPSQDEAYRNYSKNLRGVDPLESAREDALIRAYDADKGPEQLRYAPGGPHGLGPDAYKRALQDQFGNYVGYIDSVGKEHYSNTPGGGRLSTVPAGIQKDISTYDTAVANLGDAINIAKTHEDVSGPLDTVINKSRELLGDPNVPALEMRQKLASALNMISHARFGSALTRGESGRLAAEAANPTMPDATFRAEVENFYNNMQRELEYLKNPYYNGVQGNSSVNRQGTPQGTHQGLTPTQSPQQANQGQTSKGNKYRVIG